MASKNQKKPKTPAQQQVEYVQKKERAEGCGNILGRLLWFLTDGDLDNNSNSSGEEITRINKVGCLLDFIQLAVWIVIIYGVFRFCGFIYSSAASFVNPSSLTDNINLETGLYIEQTFPFIPFYFDSQPTTIYWDNETIGPGQSYEGNISENVFVVRDSKEPDNFIISTGSQALVFTWDTERYVLKETFYDTNGQVIPRREVSAETAIVVAVEGKQIVVMFKGGFYIWII